MLNLVMNKKKELEVSHTIRKIPSWLRAAQLALTLLCLQACTGEAAFTAAKSTLVQQEVGLTTSATLDAIFPSLQQVDSQAKIQIPLLQPWRLSFLLLICLCIGAMLWARAHYYLLAPISRAIGTVPWWSPLAHTHASPVYRLYSNGVSEPPHMPPSDKELQKLLHKACTERDRDIDAWGQLKKVLELFPDSAPAALEWLMDALDSYNPEQKNLSKVLYILQTVVDTVPALAPKALDRLYAISSKMQGSPEMHSNVEQTLNMVKRAMPTAVTWSGGSKDWRDYVHCPLCYCPIVFPEGDGRKPAIIFLDMDGVLMPCQRPLDKVHALLKQIFPHVENLNYTDEQYKIAFSRYLNEDALKNLHAIIDAVEASGQRPLVVISSAWRHAAFLDQLREEIFAQHKFSKYIGGKTSVEGYENRWAVECKLGFNFYKGAKERYNMTLRGRYTAIEFWLRDHHFDPAKTNFVVLDDDSGACLPDFKERFINTRYLLTAEDAQAAIDILCGNQTKTNDATKPDTI